MSQYFLDSCRVPGPGPLRHGPQNPGEQVTYQTITEPAEMTMQWGAPEGAPTPPWWAEGGFLKEGAFQPRLKEEEELD